MMTIALIAAFLITVIAMTTKSYFLLILCWATWGFFWHGLIQQKKGTPGERLAKRSVVFQAAVLALFFGITNSLAFGFIGIALMIWSFRGFRKPALV